MFLPIQLTDQFDDVVTYAEEINFLNSGSGYAVVAIQNEKIVTERYFGYHSQLPGAREIQSDSQFNVASARKTYIGLAVAWAVYEGHIKSIDDPVTDYLPGLDRNVMEDTTIRHLLTHTHGLGTDDHGNLCREFIAGRNWAYRGENIVMLTQIVQRATGKTVAQIVQEEVFNPLEFTQTGWRAKKDEKFVQVVTFPQDPPEWRLGTNTDGDQSNLFVSARELAYWGYLHLKRGKIDGQQIVPSQIIDWATSLQSPSMNNKDLPQNGFLWFIKDLPAALSELGDKVPKGSYQIVGITGPLVLVIPEHDLVIVRMYNKLYNYGGNEKNYLYYLREFGNRVMDCL